MQKAKFTLRQGVPSFSHRKLTMTGSETLVFDGERAYLLSPNGRQYDLQLSEDAYNGYLSAAANAVTRAALVRINDEERSESEIRQDLIVTGLDVSLPVKVLLDKAGIKTIKDLVSLTEAEVDDLDGVGPARMKEIKEAVEKLGKRFKVAERKPLDANLLLSNAEDDDEE